MSFDYEDELDEPGSGRRAQGSAGRQEPVRPERTQARNGQGDAGAGRGYAQSGQGDTGAGRGYGQSGRGQSGHAGGTASREYGSGANGRAAAGGRGELYDQVVRGAAPAQRGRSAGAQGSPSGSGNVQGRSAGAQGNPSGAGSAQGRSAGVRSTGTDAGPDYIRVAHSETAAGREHRAAAGNGQTAAGYEHRAAGNGQTGAGHEHRTAGNSQTSAGRSRGPVEERRIRTRKALPAGSETTFSDKVAHLREEITRKKKRRRRIIAMIVAECLVLTGIFSYAYVSRLWNLMPKPSVSKENVENPNISVDAITKMQGYWMIAIFGIDAGTGTSSSRGNSSDVNMIACINQDTGEIKLVSLYRDTYLKVNDRGTYRKFNYAYSEGGPEQALKMLNENLDLNITEYIIFNWKAVADGINILGGVDMDISNSEFKYINAFITETVEETGVPSRHLASAGMNHLDGIQAVAYGRLRLMDSDYKRVERQKKVIEQALAKAKKSDYTVLNNILVVCLQEVMTNLDFGDLTNAALNMGKYHLGETTGFPFKLSEANLGKARGACIIPQNLETNVSQLHQFLFGDEAYEPTDAVKEISQKISSDSGVYATQRTTSTTAASETRGQESTTQADSETDEDDEERPTETDENGVIIAPQPGETDEHGELIDPPEPDEWAEEGPNGQGNYGPGSGPGYGGNSGNGPGGAAGPGGSNPGNTGPNGNGSNGTPGPADSNNSGNNESEGNGPGGTLSPGGNGTPGGSEQGSTPAGTTPGGTNPGDSTSPGGSQNPSPGGGTGSAGGSSAGGGTSGGPGGASGPGSPGGSTPTSPGGSTPTSPGGPGESSNGVITGTVPAAPN